MNFKRNVVVFIIMICIFFSISCVVAGDVNDVNMTTFENQEMDNLDEDVIANSQEDLISLEDNGKEGVNNALAVSKSKGTFTELQKLINEAPIGSTINLEKDYYYDEGFNKGIGVVILKNVTINGNGHTLDGMSKSRIFFVMFGLFDNKVTLNNIVFKNGHTSLYGGAIFSFVDLTVTKCTFKNNFAKTTAGAIASVGSLNCKKCVFNNNKATGDAGAILSVNMKLSSSFFNNFFKISSHDDPRSIINTAAGLGSLIYALMNDVSLKPGTDTISGCKFYNNRATGRGGGAVYSFGHINIISSKFKSNKVGELGGAVYAAKNLYLKDSKFHDNRAGKYGGAVYFKYHEITGSYDSQGNWKSGVKFYSSTIEKCTFAQNIAKERGGAIYGFKYSEKPKLLAVKPVKCAFSDNLAPKGNEVYGGVLKNCVVKHTVLTLKNAKVKKSAKKLVLQVTLKKGSAALKSKKITFKFNGKKYSAKTNSKGIAKVSISSKVLQKLKVGKEVKYGASYDAGFTVFKKLKTAKVYR